MALNANIFIPDISGYTEFLTRTELDHASHIINELLAVLVDANFTGLTLAELEGDALLYYKKGEPLSLDLMTGQAIEMFTRFHSRLKIMERDTLCKCGACQTVSDLTLKFIVHYGAVQEIRVSNFVKASGLDVVIAHRLLKNSLPSPEYILATENYFSALTKESESASVRWEYSSETYPPVGVVPFRYARLESVRNSIPPAPERKQTPFDPDDRSVEVVIDAPMTDVYRTMTDLNGRSGWVKGLRSGEGEGLIDRINVKHLCYFDDGTTEIVPLDNAVRDDTIRYAEQFSIADRGLSGIAEFLFRSEGSEKTRLTGRLGKGGRSNLPAEAVDGILLQMKENLDRLKELCERGSSAPDRNRTSQHDTSGETTV